MANRFVPLIQDEIYHVYNRGAHKADVFTSEYDYVRFQMLLYLCNTQKNIKVRDVLQKESHLQMAAFAYSTDHALVDILAYCLMKNHVHMIVRPKVEGGLQKFMQKVMTGYSMYANKVHSHSGTMWEGRFKAKHVDSDMYLWQLFAYIHVNPVEYVAKFWKADKTLDTDAALAYLQSYHQSSFLDFYPPAVGTLARSDLAKNSQGISRPQNVLLTRDDAFTGFIRQFPKPKNLLEYYLHQDFSEIG